MDRGAASPHLTRAVTIAASLTDHASFRHPISRDRSGRDLDRPLRDPLVCARLYRRAADRLALLPRAGRAGRRIWRRRRMSTISWYGRRSASCSAAASATSSSTSRAITCYHPIEALYVWHGGMSFHGGALGVTIAIVLFTRARRISLFAFSDIITEAMPIGLFFGRIANFINGELYGRAEQCALGDDFPEWRPGAAPSEPALRSGLRGDPAVPAALCRRAAAAPGSARGSSPACFSPATRSPACRASCSASPIPQLGFLIFGTTMGQLLSIPLLIAGVLIIALGAAGAGPPSSRDRRHCRQDRQAHSRRGPADRRRLYGHGAARSRGRLLCDARPDRRARRFHHRAGDQPDLRRADRVVVRRSMASDGPARSGHPGRARARPRCADERSAARRSGTSRSFAARCASIWSRRARSCAPSRNSACAKRNPSG